MSETSDRRVTATGELPPGETDPNQLYIAVGRAIHAWEGMEEAFAFLYLVLKGQPENIQALPDYGEENRRFTDRMSALTVAAEEYFVWLPDQNREAEMEDLITTARDLSIKRHRVAHGHITRWSHIKLPRERGYHEIAATFLYRWGSPWYSMLTLRTDPIGGNAASIAVVQKEFEDLHNRIAKFSAELPRRPPPRD